ncbi:hypothetical protein A2863_04440 [Candidatus Woesebacteria bacterium RIFCSPHIGHO2_01_FULL_38_9b]|uniref:LcnD-like C-terminal domain-containing protein n=1 Tax=Candidatus Woesebacteria bacterium RIFCSPHIGHO2_01_FULL_38_9b TaxID=1802493 RepID=A0A1F7XZ63_9BACT|nr:MAG: hypothetical protein A2863_04440 [Candidatus Woesebacteria bacterium RIFCSPHIGHO2_01_FULL_38_9b]
METENKASFIKRLFKSRRRIIILLIILVAGIVGYRYFTSKRNGEVKTSRVYRGSVREELILSGEIIASEHANLNFLYSGELDYVGVVEGQEVKKGDVLAKLDSTNANQTYLQAEADLRRYDTSLDKTYDDVQGHDKDESFTQRETRVVAETNRDKAYRAFVIAQENLSNLSLKAPFDGVVTSITHPFNSINTTLTESQIEIVNPNSIYFTVSADQTEVTELKLSQAVNIILDSFPEEELQGEISYISYTPKTGEVGTVYEVKVRLTSVDIKKIRIGMSGDAKFILTEKENVLFLPPEFINSDNSGKYLRLSSPKNKTFIETGLEGEEKVEINSDKIKEGDVVYD